MRVIDQPTPETVVLGGAKGGLYVQAATIWQQCYAAEHKTAEVHVQVVPKGQFAVRMAVLPVLSPHDAPADQITFEASEPVKEWTVELHAYKVGGITRAYGFDAHECRFFV